MRSPEVVIYACRRIMVFKFDLRIIVVYSIIAYGFWVIMRSTSIE